MAAVAADLVLVNGRVRTPAHASGFTQALAVRNGTILAAGDDAGIRELAGPRTRVIDLRGRLALPAFGDAHVHAISGGLESLRCDLLGLKTRAEVLDRIAAYAAGLPPGAWVTGSGWSMEAFPGGIPAARSGRGHRRPSRLPAQPGPPRRLGQHRRPHHRRRHQGHP